MENMQIDLEEHEIFTRQSFENHKAFMSQLSTLLDFLKGLQLSPELNSELNSLLERFIGNLQEPLEHQKLLLQHEEFLQAQQEQEQQPSSFQNQLTKVQQLNQLYELSQQLQQYVKQFQQQLQYLPLLNRQELLQNQLSLLDLLQRLATEYQNLLTSDYKHIQHQQNVMESLNQFQTSIREYREYLIGHQQILQHKQDLLQKPVHDSIVKLCLDFGNKCIISKEVYNQILLNYQRSGLLTTISPKIDDNHMNNNNSEPSDALENKCIELEKKCEELQSNIYDLESKNNESIKLYLDQIEELKGDYSALHAKYIELGIQNKELEESKNSIWNNINNIFGKPNKSKKSTKNSERLEFQNLNNIHKKPEININNQDLQIKNRNLEEICKNLQINHQTLQTNNQKLDTKCRTLEKNHQTLQTNNQKLDTKCRTLEKNHQTLKTNYDNLQIKYQNLENDYRTLESKFKNHDKSMSTNLKLINDLTKTNEDLKKEATKYQSALGDATSFHLGNQDSDSAGQLSKDILDLHNILDKFCGLKKVAIINESEINKLLLQYGCSISGGVKKNKNLISGLLERTVIETIINKSSEYLELQEHEGGIEWGDQNLEMKIVNTTEQLLSLTKSIPEYRTGTDAVSKAISTKLRQQIYGVLGNRGLSNIGDKEHPLIVKLKSEINDLMNRYRTITNEEKLSENEAMINTIIRQVINIFLFRLKVQEPVAEWKFFENKSSINTIMMEASWDSGDLEEIYVDACAFPVIGSNLCDANKEDKNMK
ncbi:16633_t:CDS:1, partial [Racocetra fulgida]